MNERCISPIKKGLPLRDDEEEEKKNFTRGRRLTDSERHDIPTAVLKQIPTTNLTRRELYLLE